jgi:hypothetical protein
MQLPLDFTIQSYPTSSPINKERLGGQNRRVMEYLQSGKVLTCFIAIAQLGVFHLHSRISDLRNKRGIIIHDRTINENGITCKQYSLKPF